MAVRAALSGHLVISTVHARNKFAVIGRMMELGVSQRELYSVLNCVVYQRLILQTTGVIKPYRDVLLAENLNQAITIPQNNYTDWQRMLHRDYEKGLLDENTYRQYQAG